MKYQVVHNTTYDYTDAVPVCHNELRVTPRDHASQNCMAHELIIAPPPSRRDGRSDHFGNQAVFFSIDDPHECLSITAESVVEVLKPKAVDATKTPSWEEVRDRFALGQPPWWLDAREFTLPSPIVPTSLELAEYAVQSFPRGERWMAGLIGLTARLHHDFKYDPRATTVSTPVLDVFAMRRGVCQDFAHLQIACLRSIGLPARYVSGYLATTPPPGQAKLVGADASHAWVSAFCPEVGWIDFDPTNNQIPTLSHITLAWGRDYGDVCPVKGVITGGGGHRVRVAVDVLPLELN